MAGTVSRPTVHLIDASLYIFRAWHSLPEHIVDAQGAAANAVHGFARFLIELLMQARPSHVLVAFDESLTTSFRTAIYPQYKANREPAPEALTRQFAACRKVVTALGLASHADGRYEADDLIGSAALTLRAQGFRSVIVSADKDLAQLIGEHDEQWDPARRQRWDADGIMQRMGVRPDQVADFLALTGDAVDNIPGVPGIGAKTAAHLLAHFDCLDSLLERSEEVAFLRMRGAARAAQNLKQHALVARQSRMLTGIALDAPVPADAGAYRRGEVDLVPAQALFAELGLGPVTRGRLAELAELAPPGG